MIASVWSDWQRSLTSSTIVELQILISYIHSIDLNSKIHAIERFCHTQL
jgi:hypothetical protein